MEVGEDIDVSGERRRIAIITGANGVLGVKIAQRLLEGVCPNAIPSTQTLSEEHERIRIILACRSKQKAEVAAETLRKCFPNRTLLLEIEDLDLCCMQNIEDFCKRLLNKGRIVDWLIFNAGVTEVMAFNWITVLEQSVTEPILHLTLPRYLIERVGTTTKDGIGLIFQANVFGHYYILKRLTPLLTSSCKVQWSTSLETSIPSIYDPTDPTGIRTTHPYGSSKRFIELLHCYLTTHPHTPLYFLTHPGITSSGVVAPYQFPVRELLQKLKVIFFYIARYCGSPWHCISGRNGACSMIYCALNAGREGEMMKWGSGSDRWGRERLVGTTLDAEAEAFEEESKAAFEVVENLYKEWTFKLGVMDVKMNGIQ